MYTRNVAFGTRIVVLVIRGTCVQCNAVQRANQVLTLERRENVQFVYPTEHPEMIQTLGRNIMPKRNATTDINHENWNAEYVPEEAGMFQSAPPDVIEKRVIRSAKRRIVGGPISGQECSSVFAGFKGFSKESTNPSPFSFLASKAIAVSSNAATTNAATTNAATTNAATTNAVTTARNKEVSDAKQLTSVTQDGDESRIKLITSSTVIGNVEKLNDSFIKWITFHFHTNKHINLTPCFRDYECYMKSILNHDIAPTEETSASGSHNTNQGSQENLFSAKKVTGASNEKYIQPPVNHFSPVVSDKRSPAKNSPFRIQVEFPVPATTSLSSPFGSKDKVEASEENVDEDEPPSKVDFKPVVEDGAVYNKRCKVFVKKENAFQDHGVGMLYIKPVSSGQQTQLIVRADTSLGKILLNTLLTKSMNIQKLGKNNIMMVCIPTPDISPAKPVPVLLKVKTSEDADEMLSQLNEHTK